MNQFSYVPGAQGVGVTPMHYHLVKSIDNVNFSPIEPAQKGYPQAKGRMNDLELEYYETGEAYLRSDKDGQGFTVWERPPDDDYFLAHVRIEEVPASAKEPI